MKTPPGAVAAYAPPSAGPFFCGNCEYFRPMSEACTKPEVIKELGKNPAPVAVKGCCNFFEKR